MKLVMILSCLALGFNLSIASNTECLLNPESGMCEAYIPMYYYNQYTGECHEFVYGGCQGNGNRFDTEEECLDHCEGLIVDKASDCHKSADRGPCMGLIRRFYYDATDDVCIAFDYGGCMGNGNNFQSEHECLETCQKFK